MLEEIPHYRRLDHIIKEFEEMQDEKTTSASADREAILYLAKEIKDILSSVKVLDDIVTDILNGNL